jgi:hypothetical protein
LRLFHERYAISQHGIRAIDRAKSWDGIVALQGTGASVLLRSPSQHAIVIAISSARYDLSSQFRERGRFGGIIAARGMSSS